MSGLGHSGFGHWPTPEDFNAKARIGLWGLLAVAISACTAVSALSGSPSVVLQRDVYSAENDFAAVLPVALAYENLPRCGTAEAAGQVCAQGAIVAKITAAATAARASLKTAEAAARSASNLSALEAAALQARGDVSAFRALVGSTQ